MQINFRRIITTLFILPPFLILTSFAMASSSDDHSEDSDSLSTQLNKALGIDLATVSAESPDLVFAQDLKDLDELAAYIANFEPSTHLRQSPQLQQFVSLLELESCQSSEGLPRKRENGVGSAQNWAYAYNLALEQQITNLINELDYHNKNQILFRADVETKIDSSKDLVFKWSHENYNLFTRSLTQYYKQQRVVYDNFLKDRESLSLAEDEDNISPRELQIHILSGLIKISFDLKTLVQEYKKSHDGPKGKNFSEKALDLTAEMIEHIYTFTKKNHGLLLMIFEEQLYKYEQFDETLKSELFIPKLLKRTRETLKNINGPLAQLYASYQISANQSRRKRSDASSQQPGDQVVSAPGEHVRIDSTKKGHSMPHLLSMRSISTLHLRNGNTEESDEQHEDRQQMTPEEQPHSGNIFSKAKKVFTRSKSGKIDHKLDRTKSESSLKYKKKEHQH